MHRDRSFDLRSAPQPGEAALVQDLELDVLFDAMSNGDKFVREAAMRAVLSSLKSVDEILYRHDVLRDCMKNPEAVRALYKNSVEALESEGRVWTWFDAGSPNIILTKSVEVLILLLVKLKELRDLVDAHSAKFDSDGFRALFALLEKELTNDYLLTIRAHLAELRYDNGVLIGAELGDGNKGVNYSLRKPQQRPKPSVMSRVLDRGAPDQYTFTLDIRDEPVAKMLSELREMGVNTAANSLAQSADHVLGFYGALRAELAFYLGCLNLRDRLNQEGEPTCFPVPAAIGESRLSFQGLYDACLVLKSRQKAVDNDLAADGKDLIVVTGANRGGKSTFLRSVGLAQLLMQCGALVPAKSFASDVRTGMFVHFRREEDPTMRRGKLDEELSRMSDIVDNLSRNGMVMLNESFAATNQREGSEIAGQIVSAMLESKVKVFFVTHQYDFAKKFYEKRMPNAVFLRAERMSSGERTFKIVPGEPLQTSYGEDLYDKIFSRAG